VSVEALKRYGNHDWDCRLRLHCEPCTCGFDAAIKAAQTPEPMSDERREETIQRGMRLAWQLGQTYWQQADSESRKQNAMAKETIRKFDALLTETVTLISTQPDGWVSVPREPTDEQEFAGGTVLWEKQFEGTPWQNKVKLIDPSSMGEYNEVARHVYEAMLAAAPKEAR